MTIGSWVRRPDQKWHKVESVIADEPVTHCGRRLKTRYTPNGIKVAFHVIPSGRPAPSAEYDDGCKRCA